jgi:hypothetical protein
VELQKGIKTVVEVSLELTNDERELYEAMKIQLKENSINLSMKNVGIKQQMHTALLKKPEYKALIDAHKRQFTRRIW